MDLDEILSEIGEFGRYQKLILWFILLPCVFPCGFHAYNQLFMTIKADHWCNVPELENVSVDLAKNLSIPIKAVDSVQRFSQCTMFLKNYSTDNISLFTNTTISCNNGWIYDKKSIYQTTVITEWDLVCDKELFSTLALVLFGIAGLIGNFIFGYVQDGLGRKSAFFIYLFIQTVFGFATAFANTFYLWLIFRFGVGFTIPAILSTPNVLAIELVGPKYRVTVTVLLNIAYSLSLITLSIIVWTIEDWRILSIVTTSPFLALFFFYYLLPESPRWLISQKKYEQANKILQTMARVNGKTTKMSASSLKKIFEEDTTEITNQKQYGAMDLFKYPKLRLKTTIVTFIWFANTSVYVGLSYYAPALGGNEYFNFFLAGASELPTYLFLWPAMERYGRRLILCITMILGGSACLASFAVKNYSAITLVLYCIGKMGISSAFVVLPLMASEIYPTVVRGIGISISSVAGMLGPVFIPLINHLGSSASNLPLTIMGALSIAGGMFSLLLPETLNRRLPQSLEDGEKEGLVKIERLFFRITSNANSEAK